jgi:hypothetical protein
MTSHSELTPLLPRELSDYGFARARDLAFDAVQTLWARRRSEGMKQTDISAAVNMPIARVSKHLKGPGNWTLRTLGELVEALNGEIEIRVLAKEDLARISNYDAYDRHRLNDASLRPQANIGAQEGGNQIGGDTLTLPRGVDENELALSIPR